MPVHLYISNIFHLYEGESDIRLSKFIFQNNVSEFRSFAVLHLNSTRHDGQISIFAYGITCTEVLWKIIKTSLQHDLIIYYVR